MDPCTGPSGKTRPAANPIVSTITIFLNEERFLSEAVESVLAQSYRAWELLLVDDGSTDGSTGIAKAYASRFPDRVRYLEHENHSNRGMSASRNLGLAYAKGKYITFLDGDDVWFSRKLEQQVGILESQPRAGMLYGVRQHWRSWTANPADVQKDEVTRLGVRPNTLYEPPTLLVAIYARRIARNPGSDVIFRSEILGRVGGFEEDFRGMFEDQVFLVKVLLKEPVFVSDQCWTRYRQHAGSCVFGFRQSVGMYRSWLRFMEWFRRHMFENKMDESELWRAVRKSSWPPDQTALFIFRAFLKRSIRVVLPDPILRRLRTLRANRNS